MLELEKKLNAIKEVFSKKQIEIREVNLKKVLSGTGTSADGKQFHEISAFLYLISKLTMSKFPHSSLSS